MRASEVLVKGEKLCVAGIGDDGVLTNIVNWVTRHGEGDLFLSVGGLYSQTEEHVNSIHARDHNRTGVRRTISESQSGA